MCGRVEKLTAEQSRASDSEVLLLHVRSIYIDRKELAKVVYNRCMTPIENKDDTVVVMACVDKGKETSANLQVQSALNKYKINKERTRIK